MKWGRNKKIIIIFICLIAIVVSVLYVSNNLPLDIYNYKTVHFNMRPDEVADIYTEKCCPDADCVYNCEALPGRCKWCCNTTTFLFTEPTEIKHIEYTVRIELANTQPSYVYVDFLINDDWVNEFSIEFFWQKEVSSSYALDEPKEIEGFRFKYEVCSFTRCAGNVYVVEAPTPSYGDIKVRCRYNDSTPFVTDVKVTSVSTNESATLWTDEYGDVTFEHLEYGYYKINASNQEKTINLNSPNAEVLFTFNKDIPEPEPPEEIFPWAILILILIIAVILIWFYIKRR